MFMTKQKVKDQLKKGMLEKDQMKFQEKELDRLVNEQDDLIQLELHNKKVKEYDDRKKLTMKISALNQTKYQDKLRKSPEQAQMEEDVALLNKITNSPRNCKELE